VAQAFLALVAGETGARLIAFAGTVYLARTLGPDHYGAVGFALAVLLYLARFADVGLELGVGVREAAGARETLERMFSAVLTVRVAFAALVAVLAATLALAVLPALEGKLVALYAISLFATGASTRWVHIGLGRSGRVATVRVIAELTALGFLVLAVRAPANVLRVPFAQIIAEGTAAVALIALMVRSALCIRPRIDLALAGPVLRSGWRLMLASLLGLAVYNTDVLVLRAFAGREVVGYYTAAYLFVTFFLSAAIAYGLSLMATLRLVWADPAKRQALFQTSMAHVVLVGLPAVIGVMYVAPQVIRLILGPQYEPAVGALRWLIWSVLPAALCEVATVALIAANRENDVVRVYGFALVLVTALNLVAIPRFGIIGAAAVTIVGEVARLAFALRTAARAGCSIGAVARWWRPAVAAALMALLLVSIRPATLPIAIALGVFAYAVGLVITGALRFNRSSMPVLSV
jgi:O-antigen/teichoic acid export membrane protein